MLSSCVSTVIQIRIWSFECFRSQITLHLKAIRNSSTLIVDLKLAFLFHFASELLKTISFFFPNLNFALKFKCQILMHQYLKPVILLLNSDYILFKAWQSAISLTILLIMISLTAFFNVDIKWLKFYNGLNLVYGQHV